MASYEDLPEEMVKLAKLDINFPSLPPELADHCPCAVEEIKEYLELEGEDIEAVELEFIRTARVGDESFWIWRFDDADGCECYATCTTSPDGSTCISYDGNDCGLTPEQFMLGMYFRLF